jgi:hypothetical protein
MLKYYYKSSVNELITCDPNGMHVNTQSTDSQTAKEASAETHNPHDSKPLISSDVFRAKKLSHSIQLKHFISQPKKRELTSGQCRGT